MTTVKELVDDILGSAAKRSEGPLVSKWIDNRYKELVSRVKFRHLREVGELEVPAVYDTGTVSATRGSTTVTGTSTAWTTGIGAVGAKTQHYTKISSAWYKVASVTSDIELELTTNFSEDDVSDGAYEVVQRKLSLDSNARWVGQFILTRLRLELESISLDEMNVRYPGRRITGRYPACIAQIGVDSNNYVEVEVYPPPSETEILHYVFWNLPTALAITSTIPTQVDAHWLKEGVLIDLYRFEKFAAIRAGDLEAAAIFRNDERAQSTIWERIIGQVKRDDRGMDDTSFILKHFGARTHTREQRTAHDYVIDNWDVSY